MVTKDEAFPLIKSFVSMAKTQFHGNVKTIRSDNAVELGLSNEALQFFAASGILHQTSCTQTPQQNGVVERKHKHLLEVSRALLFQSHLPLPYWGEYLLTATFLINRTPSVLLHYKTPFELLFGQPPQLDHLRTFGCLCYVATTKQGRDKFQSRATACTFVGYPHGKKGYKVMSLSDRRIYVSRDVVFHEHIFPFAQPQQSQSQPILPSSTFPICSDVSHTVDTNMAPADAPVPTSTPPSTPEISPAVDPSSSAPMEHPRPVRAHKVPSYLKDYVMCSPTFDSHCLTTTTNLSFQPPSLSSFSLASHS